MLLLLFFCYLFFFFFLEFVGMTAARSMLPARRTSPASLLLFAPASSF